MMITLCSTLLKILLAVIAFQETHISCAIQRRIKHPPILTRGPKTTTTASPTTTEVQEVDVENPVSTRGQMVGHVYRDPFYDYLYPDYGRQYGGGGEGTGGASMGTDGEGDYEESSPVTASYFWQARPKVQTTTTTTTPEPQEQEEAVPSYKQRRGQGTPEGYCFCSPLSACPQGSIPRGGMCKNVATWLLSLRYLRCCYSPSYARWLGLYK